jgi:transposase
MQDAKLYQQFLGLPEPWAVERVEFNLEDRRVDIWAQHASGVVWSCPECSTASPTRDHAAERVWRHLDSCQFETYLHARIPRVACSEHGVRQIHVPWAEPDSRFTKQFERLAVGILAECRISGTAAILGLSWDEAQGMQERAARRREARRNARVHENGSKASVSQLQSDRRLSSASSEQERRPRMTNGASNNSTQATQSESKSQDTHNQYPPRITARGKLQRRTG